MGQFRDEAILLDFGEGGYGSTILIDTQSLKSLTSLLEIFTRLALGSLMTVDLSSFEGVFRSRTIDSFDLIRDAGKSVLEVIATSEQRFSIRWTDSPGNWQHRADLIMALRDGRLPGHQDLTEEGDGVLVVLQFQE